MPTIKEQEALMMKLAHSWLVEHDPQCIHHLGKDLHAILQNLVEVLLEMLDQLCVSQKPHDLLLVLFLYANKFVKKAGVQHNQLSNVLITSMIVSLKLWDDEAGVWNNDIASAYGRNLDDMNAMERLFLQYLEYNLYLTPEQVFLFVVSCKCATSQRLKADPQRLKSAGVVSETEPGTRKRKNSGSNKHLEVPFVFNAIKQQRLC